MAKGYSQNDLARRVGICRAYISKVERRHCVPTVDLIARFANGLQVSFLHLIDAESIDEGERDPFMLEMMAVVRSLSPGQRETLIEKVREISLASHYRTVSV